MSNAARDARRAEARAVREAERKATYSRLREMAEKALRRGDPDPAADEEGEEDSPEAEMGSGAVLFSSVEHVPAPSLALTLPEAHVVVERHGVSEERLNEVAGQIVIARVRAQVVEPPVRAPIIEQLPERGAGPGQPAAESDQLHAQFVKQAGRENLSASKMSQMEAWTDRQWAISRAWSRTRREYADDLRWIEEQEDALRIEIRDESPDVFGASNTYDPTRKGWGAYRPKGSEQKRRQARQIELNRLREGTLEQIRVLGPKPKMQWLPPDGWVGAQAYVPGDENVPDGTVLAVVPGA